MFDQKEISRKSIYSWRSFNIASIPQTILLEELK